MSIENPFNKSSQEVEEPANENEVQAKNKEKEPSMEMPEEIEAVKALQSKLAEYKERLKEQEAENPYAPPEAFNDTRYKIVAMEKLLTEGSVNMDEFSKDLRERFGSLDIDTLGNAFLVVEDYATTKGDRVSGGTGLKAEQESEQNEETGEQEDVNGKFDPKNIREALRDQSPIEVTVKRSSGDLERGWYITAIQGETATVMKSQEEDVLQKQIPLQELQELNKSTPEEKIASVATFEQLKKALEESGGIQGSKDFYEPEQLKSLIERVRKGDLELTYITRTAGLREKVKELMEAGG